MPNQQNAAAADFYPLYLSLWSVGIHPKSIDYAALFRTVFGIEREDGLGLGKRPVYHGSRTSAIQVKPFKHADAGHEGLQLGQGHTGAVVIFFHRDNIDVTSILGVPQRRSCPITANAADRTGEGRRLAVTHQYRMPADHHLQRPRINRLTGCL
ncbi:hypothetical protein D3C71_1282470 [compost metagenome]